MLMNERESAIRDLTGWGLLPRNRALYAGLAVLALAIVVIATAPPSHAAAERYAAGRPQDVPAGYQPEPERESLRAVDDPAFVPAAAAQLRPEAWVIGVEIDGQTRAYGLELLNDHEVVNDEIGGTAFAVVWTPYANAALTIDREIDDLAVSFEPAPGLIHAGSVLRDRETGSYWSVLAGRAVSGPLAGTALTVLPVSDRMSWAEWSAHHPDTQVLSVAPSGGDGRGGALQDPGTDRYGAYFAQPGGHRGAEATDGQLATKQLVYALHHAGVAHAVDLRRVIGGRSFTLQDGSHILVYREAADRLGRGSAAFISRAGFEQRGGSWIELASDAEFNAITRDFGGSGIPRLNGFDTFWYTWSLANPDTAVLR
jgi:hypothetical protein